MLPLANVNQLEEGDKILYAPLLRPNEKRKGEITVVLVSSIPQPDQKLNFAILDSRDADRPAQWTVPFRSSLAMYVYGPSGLSARKLKGFLAKDQELVAQLADYAQKTAQTETVLQAIADYEHSGSSENLGAALQGFAGQYGITGKIDRNAPADEQTIAAIRTLNPALSSYDPISPSGSLRVSQTAGLAATVAGMFLGSTVGLAAGGTAMALNLKTLLFPAADFRSAYSQTSDSGDSVALCSARDPFQSRKRLAYLWALRIPDAPAPKLKIASPSYVPSGLKSLLSIEAPEKQWKLAGRIRKWSLTSLSGATTPVQVLPIQDQHRLELNLMGKTLPPGKYKLSGSWDWESFDAEGEVHVGELSQFEGAHLTPDSQNRLQQLSGKQVITLVGSDFQFVEKASIMKKADKYASPAPIPFSLPSGARHGPQQSLEMQVDTTALIAGEYSILLYQADGNPRAVDVKILPAPPKIKNLPFTLNGGEREQNVILEGEGLDTITGLSADGLQFDLEPSGDKANSRIVHVRHSKQFEEGASLDLKVHIRDFAQPIVLPGALFMAGPKPRIRSAAPSLPSDLQIALRPGELPAGVQIGLMIQVSTAGSQPALTLGCRNTSANTTTLQAGTEKNGIKLNAMQAGALFLTLDPAIWPGGCQITAVLENGSAGASEPFDLGRVLRVPHIDDFKLTEESAGEGDYIGILTGRELELIGKTGWDAGTGQAPLGLPAPIAGDGNKQTLRIRVTWPSPSPRSPLFVWFRGEQDGRATTIRY